jgi:hypothetical protein
VVVGAGAGEADQVVGVPVGGGESSQIGQDLHLGDALGEIEWPVQADRGGDLVEQRIQPVEPDPGQHLPYVVVRVRGEPHGTAHSLRPGRAPLTLSGCLSR